MKNYTNKPILYSTRQIWKLWVLYFGSFMALLILISTKWLEDSLPENLYMILMLCAFLLAIGSIIFPCVAIKCPKCQTRWFWYAVSKKSESEGIRWLFSQTKCPVCKSDFN